MNKKISLFIIGGTGDLAKKKILPALHSLYKSGELENLHRVYSLARKKDKDWERLTESFGEEKMNSFLSFDVTKNSSYNYLGNLLNNLKGHELIFYLSISPFLFEETIKRLGPLLRNFTNPRKVVIEKPFGFDLQSAKRLNELLYRYFIEDEIYRIDHFLGKYTVQNILSLRLSNTIFEGLWNKNFVDHVQIAAIEDVGIEGRGEYYDRVGAIRDMLQNHMLQMLSFLSMELPCCTDAESIRDEKVKLLRSIRRLEGKEIEKNVVKGQYEGYLTEGGVKKDSRTETFVAAKFYVDNPRWQDVPFYLITGKKLHKKLSQIAVVFREVPRVFSRMLDCTPKQNKVIFQAAPKNKIIINFELRPPSGSYISCPMETVMEYDIESYTKGKLPEAYETLLLDIVKSDRTLFIRGDEIESMWEVVQPITEKDGLLYTYEQGSYGPQEAKSLMEQDGKAWIL
ncbi:MAG: glucose-6-phosphate dehydrogenase [Aquificaceae bacterium]